MCNAFSCWVLKSGEVRWKFGLDSHDEIGEEFHLRDLTADKAEMLAAKVEIYPDNGSYLAPDRWVFKLDEERTPEWWTPLDEKAAWKAHTAWKRKLYRILVRKPIVHPFKIAPPKKISRKHLSLLKSWVSVGVSVWASVRDSVRDSVGAYYGSFFRLPRSAWKGTEKIPGDYYPFQPAVDLWEAGLVPSFDGKVWRLHGEPTAKTLWEGTL